jgi:plasmid stabilization system protein ParE
MNYSLVFLPDVAVDIRDAFEWYQKVSTGLGHEFLRMFFANTGELQWNPEINRKVFEDFRRRLMNRFPYVVYYRLEGARIIIYGIFHCARNPKVIKKAISSRS